MRVCVLVRACEFSLVEMFSYDLCLCGSLSVSATSCY